MIVLKFWWAEERGTPALSAEILVGQEFGTPALRAEILVGQEFGTPALRAEMFPSVRPSVRPSGMTFLPFSR